MSETQIFKEKVSAAPSPQGSKKRSYASLSSPRLLHQLENSLSDIRELITCRVCVHPLYEPYTTECGHTFCYGCLIKWFEQDRTKISCPDCRAVIVRQPAPAYVIKDVAQIFSNRAELMPGDETIQEHQKWQEEEKQKVELDRTSHRGLFNGVFKRQNAGPLIRDEQDGVIRCPRCTWELEDGTCGSCGWGSATDTDDSLSMDDDRSVSSWPGHETNVIGFHDEGGVIDLDGRSVYPEEMGVFHGIRPFPEPFSHYDSFLEDEDEDEDDEGDSTGSLDQFVVNDDDTDGAAARELLPPFSDSEDANSDTVRTVDSDEDHRSQEETESAFSGEHISRSTSRHPEDTTDSEPIPQTGRRRPWEEIIPEHSNQRNRRHQSPSSETSLHRHCVHRSRRVPRLSSSRPPQPGNPVTILLESDSEDSAIPTRRRRRRPCALRQFLSDDDEEPQANVVLSDEDRRGNSSETATIGRLSSRYLQDSSAAAPTYVDSSPAGRHLPDSQREREQSIPGAFPPSFSSIEPSQSACLNLTTRSPSETPLISSGFSLPSIHEQGACEGWCPHGSFSPQPSNLGATAHDDSFTTPRHPLSDQNSRPTTASGPAHRRSVFDRSPSSSRVAHSPRQHRRPGTEASITQAGAARWVEAREAKRRRQKSERRRREQSASIEGTSNGQRSSSGVERLQTIEL